MQFEPPTLDDARDALDFLSPDMPRDEWAQVAMALKNEFGELGFDAFDAWSRGGESYRPESCRATWRSVRAFGAGGSISIAYIFRLAIDRGYSRKGIDLSAEQRQANAEERARIKAARDLAEAAEVAHIKKWHAVMAEAAAEVVARCGDVGASAYLRKKKVMAHGLRFPQYSFILRWDEQAYSFEMVTGKANIDAFFRDRDEAQKFRFFKPGVIVLPLFDEHGGIANIQCIHEAGSKTFLPGRKEGCFFPLGGLGSLGALEQGAPLLVGEGYATCASAHEATGFVAVVALDAGNLPKVAAYLRGRLPDAKLVVLCDDDAETEGNPGVTKGMEAARLVGGFAVVPQFAEVAHAE